MVPTKSDQADRIDIAKDLDSTLFVEAGAGTGKTTALVDRVISLLDSGVAMENIAAITFTEKAAEELKSRLRQELSKSRQHAEALDQLDSAAITTLHGFALRILSQHAIEAGLPPRLEVSTLDAFEDRWEESLEQLLYNSDHEETLVLALMLGVKVSHLRDLAQSLDNDWDMVQDRLGVEAVPSGPLVMPDFSNLISELQDVAELGRYCLNHEDKLLDRLSEIATFAGALSQARHDAREVTSILFGPTPSFRVGKRGQKDNWPADCPVDQVREQVAERQKHMDEVRSQIIDAVLERLCRVLARDTLDAAQVRKNRGVLEFHDLLVLARNLLRDSQHGREVRRVLAERYQRLLLDEFQDTDPIQIELAKLIATPSSDNRPWAELHDEPGRLFYVGDPKQSIYRFRRANIELYTKVGEAASVTGKTLSRNFRTAEPIIAWINGLFTDFMTPTLTDDRYMQPYYRFPRTRPRLPTRRTSRICARH